MINLWCSTNDSQINANELSKNKYKGKKNFKFHIQQVLNCIHENYNIPIRSTMRLWPSSRPKMTNTLLHLKINPWNQFETIVIIKCEKIFAIVMATRCFQHMKIGLACKDKWKIVVKEFQKIFNYMLRGRCTLWWFNINKNYIPYKLIQDFFK